MKRTTKILAVVVMIFLGLGQGLARAGSGKGQLHLTTFDGLLPGFVVLAQHRFDPAVQRWLAEQSLKALPLRGGQLFYVIPVNTDPMLEEFQIRYLEEMLNRQPAGSGDDAARLP